MKKILLLTLPAITALFLISGFTACEKKGPMERAGESIDDAAEDVSDKIDDATSN